MKKNELPISPHLQIYKPQLTSVLSISHRIAGIFLISLLPLVTIWLTCLILGESIYQIFIQIMSLFISKIILIFICFGFSYHMLNGIRHIFWDFGVGVDIKNSSIWGVVIILSSFIITIFFGVNII